mgnify:CR=1 FL=1
MTAKKLSADMVGIPEYAPVASHEGATFDLSSHRRAREALELAVSIPDTGFNVFVLGENRSGRLTSTVEFLEKTVIDRPPPGDWVYVNNFQRPWEPLPVRLPVGAGRGFRDRMEHLVQQLTEALRLAFGGADFQKRLQAEGDTARQRIGAQMEALQSEANKVGLDIVQTPQGPMIVAIDDKGEPVAPDALSDAQRTAIETHGPEIAERIREIGRGAAEMQAAVQERALELGKQTADYTCGPLIDAVIGEFKEFRGLTRWLVNLRNDMIEHYRAFLPAPEDAERPAELNPARRYAVNLFVDHKGLEHAPVVVEANPTYDNLFGRIEYRQSMRTLETDFTLIRAGALHKANGGILVLRADGVASAPGVWPYLKAALRDSEIRIEEPYRTVGPAVAGAPTPGPIPLNIKVVLIGAPRWYYTFFSADPEFQNYFKIKADIDPDMEATEENLATYAGLIHAMARTVGDGGLGCDDAAVGLLLGLTSRWAADRGKLSSQFERVSDVLAEAHQLADADGAKSISRVTISRAIENRRRRNARIEDRIQEGIAEKSVLISTSGAKVGQINALTVRDMGDHAFGTPSRVTASASVGRRGVLNIERDTGLGGPIQQKGALVLQGWLSGRFARTYPLSFDVSITFEQSYGGVDGDSASLAELVAILSDLSGVPVRQSLAITGSLNQRGEAQAIGGAHHKIEGFFRTCIEAGALDGNQGVAVPVANEENLVLNAEVETAVREGKFALYSLATIEDAVELFLGLPAGKADADGIYPPDSVYGKVAARLEAFDRALTERLRPV